MAKNEISSKRVAISKANAQMVAVVAVASFVSIFCLVATKTVFSQNQYQARVIKAKETARDQAENNLEQFKNLNTAYQAFNSTATNVIGGTSEGTGDKDGPNAEIILDALPSNYDFPALTSSLEKIFKDNHLSVSSITGTDDELNQQQNSSSSNPQPVEIPFTFTVNNASYQSITQLINTLQLSIRPLTIDKLDVSGENGELTVTVTGHTYFQPAKNLDIKTKDVK